MKKNTKFQTSEINISKAKRIQVLHKNIRDKHVKSKEDLSTQGQTLSSQVSSYTQKKKKRKHVGDRGVTWQPRKQTKGKKLELQGQSSST